MDEPITLINPQRSFFLLARFVSRAARWTPARRAAFTTAATCSRQRQHHNLRHGLKDRSVLFVNQDVFLFDQNVVIADDWAQLVY
jgi:hypothetical protein